MNLDSITPLVITYNEAPNIADCLETLSWAKEVVVLDSFSTDETLAIVSRFPNARLVQRPFDSFASQCNFGIREAGISSEWVLCMDADYRVTPSLLEKMKALGPLEETSAYEIPFRYCIYGRPLRGSLYPPVKSLFRKARCRYRQDGHAHRLEVVNGGFERLGAHMWHDDWKPMARWLQSQSQYMDQEVEKLLSTPKAKLGSSDRLRTAIVVAPFAAFAYALFYKGAILDGWRGWLYASQRLTAELVLSMKLLERKLGRSKGVGSEAATRRAGASSL